MQKQMISQIFLFLFTACFLYSCGNEKEAMSDTKEFVETKEEKPKSQKKASPHPYEKEMKKWMGYDGLRSSCEGSKLNLAIPVNIIAANITKDSLAYNVEPFSDCSGVFLRFLDSLEARCPKKSYPDPASHRDSRALAKWYHEKGKLVRVEEPLNMAHYIKPGSVMFYGGRGVENKELSLDDLFAHGGINHVGVVTEVEEKNGEIVGYSLFHGQRPGKLASTTNYHQKEYRNRTNYPHFGNGTEQWVAVAPIVDTDGKVFN
ncbi:MAG: hypothetical protein AAFR87_17360 [Bacteroidota bacterium]